MKLKFKHIICSLVLIAAPLLTNAQHGAFIEESILSNMNGNDKAAILVVHFGTTHSDTRQKNIEPLNKAIEQRFPEFTVREAYSSRIINKILRKRGQHFETPSESLIRLNKEGYTHVIIQPTFIIEGVESEALRKEAQNYQSLFKDLRIGNPLLYFTEDYSEVAKILCKGRDGWLLFAGHGSYDPATAQYAMLQSIFNDLGFGKAIVGTIEGYPSFEISLNRLKKAGAKEVTLCPLMFVAGDHAKNDLAIDWKKSIEEGGIKVVLDMRGLGEYPQIRELFLKNIDFISNNKKIDILSKKEKYAR